MKRQLFNNVLAHPGRCGRGQRNNGNVRERIAERPQIAIIGTEIVTPLGNAVRLINGEQADLQGPEKILETELSEPFRRDI